MRPCSPHKTMKMTSMNEMQQNLSRLNTVLSFFERCFTHSATIVVNAMDASMLGTIAARPGATGRYRVCVIRDYIQKPTFEYAVDTCRLMGFKTVKQPETKHVFVTSHLPKKCFKKPRLLVSQSFWVTSNVNIRPMLTLKDGGHLIRQTDDRFWCKNAVWKSQSYCEPMYHIGGRINSTNWYYEPILRHMQPGYGIFEARIFDLSLAPYRQLGENMQSAGFDNKVLDQLLSQKQEIATSEREEFDLIRTQFKDATSKLHQEIRMFEGAGVRAGMDTQLDRAVVFRQAGLQSAVNGSMSMTDRVSAFSRGVSSASKYKEKLSKTALSVARVNLKSQRRFDLSTKFATMRFSDSRLTAAIEARLNGRKLWEWYFRFSSPANWANWLMGGESLWTGF